MNNRVKVVVIDSGIDINNMELKGKISHRLGLIIDENGKIKKVENPKCRNIHGTIIASCINHMWNNIELIDINILNENLMTNGETLIEALKIAEEFHPHVVNLSLGTLKLKYCLRLKRVINKLVKNNTIIVSAVDNRGARTYPAAFKNVVGVKSQEVDIGKICYKHGYFYASPWLKKDIIYCEDYKKYCGNSIATAYVSGWISKEISEGNLDIQGNLVSRIL